MYDPETNPLVGFAIISGLNCGRHHQLCSDVALTTLLKLVLIRFCLAIKHDSDFLRGGNQDQPSFADQFKLSIEGP
jgi:hypothetical protein